MSSNLTKKLTGALAIAMGVALLGAVNSVNAAPPAAEKLTIVSAADPLAGDTWHAVSPSWPGTIRFDTKTKAVILEPLGSHPIEAKYSIKDVSNKTGSVEGALTMTTADGKISASKFTIVGKNLTMFFANGQTQETYVRLSPKEAEAEKARLVEMMKKLESKK